MNEPSGLEVLHWQKRNSARVKHVKRNRIDRGYDAQAPLALDGFVTPSSPTKPELRLRALIGGRNAEAFLRRVDEYCALNAAHDGKIHVRRSQFGRVVLSRDDDAISRGFGEKIFDALLDAQLASSLGDVTSAEPVTSQKPHRDVTSKPPVTSRDSVGDVTDAGAVTSQAPPGDVTSGPPVTSRETASRTPERGQARGQARISRAEGAREETSLEGPSGDVTRETPDQTGERQQEREAGAASSPVRLAWELLGISFDRDDERRVAAKGLVDRKPHDAAWTAAAVELLRQPRRTTKAVVGMVVSA